MFKFLPPIFLLLFTLTLPLPASAAMSDAEASEAVAGALAGGQSGEAIIDMLVEDGRSLEQATLLAVGVASGRERMELARAGICAAGDDSEAQQIGQGLVDLVSPGEEADEVEGLVAMYVATQCKQQPDTYRGAGSPGGGTPLQQGTGGKRPTFPGVRPPVSPSS